MATISTTGKNEVEDISIIFNGIVSHGKPFTLSISKELISTIPFLQAMIERWIKGSAKPMVEYTRENTIELNMDQEKNIIASSLENYFNLRKQVLNPTNDISDTLSKFSSKMWIDLFEIVVHLADFQFYDEHIAPHLPNYKIFSHSIHSLPDHMSIQFGEQYVNDCLVAKYRCTICNNYDYYCEEKEQFDKLAEDVKDKIYSMMRNKCSVHDHNTSFFMGRCTSPTCPDRSFKIDGWTVIELGHLLHNLECYMERIPDSDRANFKSFTVDDLCTCRYLFDGTFIKFVKTDEIWARFVWDYIDRTTLLSPFDLEQKVVDKLVGMNFDQFVDYIDQNAWKTPKNTFKSKCSRYRFRYMQ